MISETQKFDLEKLDTTVGRKKSEIRERMDTLSVGEGFDVEPQSDVNAEKRKAQAVSNNLNPIGKSFSVRWLEGKKSFRVIRTK